MYAQRYGLSLQEIFFGDDWFPNNEVDCFFIHMAYWLKYLDYTREQMIRYEIEDLDDDIIWNQVEFNKLIDKLEKQKDTERKSRKKKK